MRELLTEVATLQAPSATAATSQFSVSYPTTVSNVRCRILPVNQTRLLGALGNIAAETFQAWIDGIKTVMIGSLLVHNSITYEVLSVESWGNYLFPNVHKVLLKRRMST